MVFTSLQFLIFFCIVFLAYYILPKKFQWLVLLVASIYFYLTASAGYIVFLIMATLITYLGALKINNLNINLEAMLKQNDAVLPKDFKKNYKKRVRKNKKIVLIVSIALTLSMLFVMKYTDFILGNVSLIFNIFNVDSGIDAVNFILPLGISFYTFMSLSYIIDVYREEYLPEKNFLKYLLYVSYFPHILQGPMDKYPDLSKELFRKKNFDYSETIKGIYRIVVGIIKKMVVADKISIIISAVTDNLEEYTGINIIIMILLYAIELYADFSGYMDIAIGCSRMLGIKIAENFEAPYFSKSIAEYWRRWHISLGTWFREYVYYPILRSNRAGKIRKYYKNKENKFLANTMPNIFSLAILWILIGFWHGSTWGYVLYGVYHGLIIITSTILSPIYNKFHNKFSKFVKSKIYGVFQIIRTFILVLIGYFLFSVGNLNVTIQMFKNLFISNGSLSIFSLFTKDYAISIIIGVILMFILDILLIKKIDIYEKIRKLPMVIRWIVYSIGLFIVIMFASGEAQEFMYFQF